MFSFTSRLSVAEQHKHHAVVRGGRRPAVTGIDHSSSQVRFPVRLPSGVNNTYSYYWFQKYATLNADRWLKQPNIFCSVSLSRLSFAGSPTAVRLHFPSVSEMVIGLFLWQWWHIYNLMRSSRPTLGSVVCHYMQILVEASVQFSVVSRDGAVLMGYFRQQNPAGLGRKESCFALQYLLFVVIFIDGSCFLSKKYRISCCSEHGWKLSKGVLENIRSPIYQTTACQHGMQPVTHAAAVLDQF